MLTVRQGLWEQARTGSTGDWMRERLRKCCWEGLQPQTPEVPPVCLLTPRISPKDLRTLSQKPWDCLSEPPYLVSGVQGRGTAQDVGLCCCRCLQNAPEWH